MSYNSWKNKIKPEKRKRTYKHIDNPYDLDSKKVFEKIVTTIKNIETHQFLPFIKRNKEYIRFRKDPNQEFPTKKKKTRKIMYASHKDAHIYSYYNFLISEYYKKFLEISNLSENIIAYRKVLNPNTNKGKNNIFFAKEVFDFLQNQQSCIVITDDIQHFFDELNHSFLKEKLAKICSVNKLDSKLFKVFKSLTSYKYIEYEDFIKNEKKIKSPQNRFSIYKTLNPFLKENKTTKGIPQGSPISGVLANIYLIDFDLSIKKNFPDIFYRRYSDDLLFICKDKDKDSVISFVREQIKKSFLDINPSKSFISYFATDNDGSIECKKVTDGNNKELKNRNYFDYLGLEITGKKVFLRKKTLQVTRFKQIRKVKRHLRNTQKNKWKQVKPSKNNRHIGDYLKRVVGIFKDKSLSRQVLKVIKARNKTKKGKID